MVEGGQVGTRADTDQMKVREGHRWRNEGKDGGRSVFEALIRLR